MVNEKIKQAVAILQEKNIDMWLTFVRESSTSPDPMLELILGTNCTWPSAFIITATGAAIAIVGSLDVQNIKDHAGYDVIGYRDSIKDELLTVLNKYDPQKIAINYSKGDVIADGLSYGMYLLLQGYLQDTKYLDRLIQAEEMIAALRGRKSQGEIQYIKNAITETLEIFDQVTDFVKVGMTEKQVSQFILDRVREKGLGLAWDADHCPAVFTGPDTAGAHAGPTDREIRFGHIMNIDFGVKKDDYVSDLQRTWYFLKPGETQAPESVQYGFNTIKEAIQKAAQSLRPGVEGWTIDKVARDYIVSKGYGEYPHALGHQVGRKAHDGSALLCPIWDRYQNLPFLKIEESQVYTIEPRLTVDGYGVATIEEIVQVTADGCVFLSEPQQELILIKN